MKTRTTYFVFIIISFLFYLQCSTKLEKTGALLEVSPSQIRFTQLDSIAIVTVKNMGNEDLSWKIQSTPDWLIYSKQKGELTPGISDTFMVKYERSLLDTIVEYREEIVISSNENSATIQVIFQSEQPNLKVSTTKLEFAPGVLEQKIAIANSRNGYLDWSATVSVDWISISPDTGHTGADQPDTMTITIDPEKFSAPGEYAGAIKINSDATGSPFFTKTTENIKVTYYYLGVDVSDLRDGEKVIFPIVTYENNAVPVPTEVYIKPIGQKKNCRWEIISGEVPAAVQFSETKYNNENCAKFSGAPEMEIYAELMLRVTDAMNSSIEVPVILVTRNIEVFAPQLVSISGGSFTMGDNWGDGLLVERPAHEVTLNSFQMSKFEVTNEEFYKFVLARGYHIKEYWLITDGSQAEETAWNLIVNNNHYQPSNWSNSDTPWDTCSASNHATSPVVGVSWYEAYAYCKWLSQVTGKSYRLPTEAQWERAARGSGEGTKYPWGNDWNDSYANWNDGGEKDGYQYAAPVGSFENGKSAAGCYDLAGNVWEWCQDWYADYEEGTFTEPTGPASGDARVVRGGSWKSIPRSLRTVSRTKLAPHAANTNVGFRVVIGE